jgi:hypothetical protein
MRVLVVFLMFAARVWGCSCVVSPSGNPPCQSAWQFETVFTGTVESIDVPVQRADFAQKKVRMTVGEGFRGLAADQREVVIETGMGGGDCGYGFERGRKYIVYASKKPGGGLSTGICSPTRPVEDAEEEVKYFHSLATAPPVSEIRVTAIDPTGDWVNGQLPALPGATITIDGPGVHQTAVSDASGRRVFEDLPPGEYKVTGSLESHTGGDALRPVRVYAKGCAEVLLPLPLDRAVTGRVLNRDGQPVTGVGIEAVPARPRFPNEMPSAADSATTDTGGRYTLPHLRAGDYFLGVSLTHPPTPEQPYTRWFYPGTEDPARAVLLHVLDKPGAQRFDLTLPPAQHDRTVRGIVYWPDGRPAEGVNVHTQDPRWPWWPVMASARTGADGRFSLQVLDGTAYRLHAIQFANPPVSAAPAPIAPGTAPLELQLVLTQRGNSMTDSPRGAALDWRIPAR